MRRFSFLLWCCFCVPPAFAQASSGAAFEVASIHVHPPSEGGKIGFHGSAGGRVVLGACKLAMLIAYAFDIDDRLISGIPDWATKVSYDINASPPDSSPSRKLNLSGYTRTPTSEQREMILNLMVERFGLRYHIEERETSAYLLERGKGPLRLEPSKHPERAADPRGGLVLRGDLVTGEGFGENLTMSFLAQTLARLLERPVVDRTGLTGIYDFHVDPIEPDNHDKITGALLLTQALGLKLTAGHAPVRAIHIDAAIPPTPN